jgi:hypothetical protein
MDIIVAPALRFIGLLLLQVFILNAIEPGLGIYIMVYPLFIAIIPFSYNIFTVLTLSFILGFCIDLFSNTFGLHASAATTIAMLRPIIYKYFSPRDGYDVIKNPNVLDMGFRWHFLTFGSLLIIHHFWFFFLESFRIDEILTVLKKTSLSALSSFIVCWTLQYVFFQKEKSR